LSLVGVHTVFSFDGEKREKPTGCTTAPRRKERLLELRFSLEQIFDLYADFRFATEHGSDLAFL
jgi:hypothetical protein